MGNTKAIKKQVDRFITLVESDVPCRLGQPFATLVVLGLSIFMLITGIAYSASLGDTLRFQDEHLYVRLAEELLVRHAYSLDGITPTAYRPPGYNFILHPIFYLGGRVVHVRMAQFLFLALSMVLLHKILYGWSYRLASVIAGVLICGYPILFYTAGTVYPQTVTTLLFLIVCYLVVRPQVSLGRWCAGGIVFGCLLLTTPMFLALMPLWLGWPWALRLRRPLAANLVFLLVTAGVVTPWLLRNQRAFGQFVFISANSGLMLLLGNSEHTDPNSGSTTDISKYEQIAKQQGLTRLDTDVFYQSEALKWIRQNKIRTVKLYFAKLAAYFNFHNKLEAEAENTWWRDTVMFVTYYPLLLLACLRIWRGGSVRSRPFEKFALLSYLISGTAYAVFFTRLRYRLPLDWMLISLAAISAASLLDDFKRSAMHGST